MTAVHLFPIHLSGGQIFGNQQNHRGQESFGGIIEKLILSIILTAGIDDGFGDNLYVLFRFCL